MQVPADKYWGAQTERSRNNFKMAEASMPKRNHLRFRVFEKRPRKANHELGVWLPIKRFDRQRCAVMKSGTQTDDQFPLVIWQTGSGTQSNMNVNEVVAYRAHVLSGGKLTDEKSHPNDDVNKSQSSNDTYPTAMHCCL